MHIVGYDTAFGECFLIDEPEKNRALLVDYGSDTPYILESVRKNILEDFRKREFSILLTHFHQDHINGFWKASLSGEIDIHTVYIPDIFSMRRARVRFDFLQLQVLSDLFSSVVLERKPAEITLYSLLKQLTGIRAKIVFLHSGNEFSFASQNFQVLWPNFNILNIDPRIEKSLIPLLQKFGIVDHSIGFDDGGKGPVSIQYVDDFINALLDAYGAFAGSEYENLQSLMGRVEEAFQVMSRFFTTQARELSEEVSDSFLNDLKGRLAGIKNQGNRISIVFQDQPRERMSRILMTGDIPASDMKKIIAGPTKNTGSFPLSQKYTAIKAPHHGTYTHFVESFPPCDYFLISNGQPSSAHKKWGKISYLYSGFYASNKGCQIECTYPRCQILDMKKEGANPCEHCKKGSKRIRVDFS